MWTVAVQQHFFYTTEARVHSDMECVGRVVVGGAINENHDEFGIRIKFSASYHFIRKKQSLSEDFLWVKFRCLVLIG